MSVLLGQLVYTSFPKIGSRLLTSTQVPIEIQQTFIQQVVYKHWDSYNPPRSGYRAAYIHQVTPTHNLFGWLYNEAQDELGRSHVPYFICYYLPGLLHAVHLENIFTCLHRGPVELIDRLCPVVLDIVAPDLWSYQPARMGVSISLCVRKCSYAEIQQGRLLNLLIPANEQEIVIELEQIYNQQTLSVQPSLIATVIPQLKPFLEDTTSTFEDNSSKQQVEEMTDHASIPTFSNKSIFLIGIATGVGSIIPLIALCIIWIYYSLQPPTPASKVQQSQMVSPWQ